MTAESTDHQKDCQKCASQASFDAPETKDFVKAVEIEAAHQREKWGDEHDECKSPGEWAMLLDKIKGKQCQAVWDRDWEKYAHHLITMAAICANAHRILRSSLDERKKRDAEECIQKMGTVPLENG